MEVASDRRYHFPVPPEAFWTAIGAVEQYQRWWPWLRTFEAAGLVAGDVWRCAVRPPLRYTVRFDLHLGAVEAPTSIIARVDGDIEGVARLVVAPHAGGGCDVRLTSRLAPRHRALGLLAVVAAPMVRRGHDWVLDTGARQFAGHALGVLTSADGGRGARPGPAGAEATP